MSTYLEICVSPDRDDLLDTLKQAALSNNLEYEESSLGMFFDSVEGGSHIISKNIKFVTTVSAIAGFLIQIQPTIQEIIKADASKGITISCGEKKIEIKGGNDIEEALSALKKLDCDPKP
jgi:hypothetical protein